MNNKIDETKYFIRRRYIVPKGEIRRDYGKPVTGKEELDDSSQTSPEE